MYTDDLEPPLDSDALVPFFGREGGSSTAAPPFFVEDEALFELDGTTLVSSKWPAGVKRNAPSGLNVNRLKKFV